MMYGDLSVADHKFLGSHGVTSKIVNGKRTITKEQAKQLGAFFGVSPAVLSDLIE